MEKTKDLSRQLLTKTLCFAVMIAAAVWMFGCYALQAHAATAKVTGSSVNIRKEASTSSDKVGSANRGDTFTIQSEVTGADGKVWYQITVNNQTGYIRSDLAEKSGDAATTPTISLEGVTEVMPVSAKVTGNLVRVRPDASTNGSVVTTVEKDAVVTVNGTAVGADGKTWYLISFNSGSGDVTGYIREDFLSLSGELVPAGETTPEVPPVEEPSTEVPEPTVTVNDYDTEKDDGKWYLVDNTGEKPVRYVIADIFAATNKNAELYTNSQKTVKTQKIVIVILVLLLVAGGIGATLLIFKMKDMLDDAYFEEIEKEVASKRQNKQQNVMHTVGKDGTQKKPTVNGQQRPAAKPQQVSGQPKQMRPQQAGTQPRPNTTAQNGANQPAMSQTTAAQTKTNGAAQNANVSGGQSVKPQGSGTAKVVNTPIPGTVPAKPAAQQSVKNPAKPANAKANQEWKSKNFMSDDDDFEFEFLNWDGEDDL